MIIGGSRPPAPRRSPNRPAPRSSRPSLTRRVATPASEYVARDEHDLQQLLVDIAWREEALHALLWTLGFVDDLPPDRMCPRQPAYEQLAPGLDPGRARQDVNMRGLDEIVAMLDFYYCLHWHARRAQYHGDAWDPHIAPSVVLERRRALEWVFQDAPWEDVDLAG